MEFPDLGKHCEHLGCKQLDFLPYECDSCKKTFCGDHRRYQDHTCTKVVEKDRKVATCPLCEKPISAKPGEDINSLVDQHIIDGCKDIPKDRVYKNRCTVKGCRQSELIPIQCKNCKQQFCLRHRAQMDHSCPVKSNETIRQLGPFKVPIKVK